MRRMVPTTQGANISRSLQFTFFFVMSVKSLTTIVVSKTMLESASSEKCTRVAIGLNKKLSGERHLWGRRETFRCCCCGSILARGWCQRLGSNMICSQRMSKHSVIAVSFVSTRHWSLCWLGLSCCSGCLLAGWMLTVAVSLELLSALIPTESS